MFFLFFNALWVNFAEKNFEFAAWWNFQNAKKYINLDYFKIIGIFLLLLIAVIILMFAIIFVLVLTGAISQSMAGIATNISRTPVLIGTLIYSSLMSFVLLIYTNLSAQNYYNVVEKK